MKTIDYAAGDIVVCLRAIKDRGGKHKQSKSVIKDYFYKCIGVYNPTVYNPKEGITCGLDGFTFILTASRFRKATEEELLLYNSGAKSINVQYIIFN